MADWLYHAQNILTGEWLHHEVPLSRDELRWDLSGPGALRGRITPQKDEGLVVNGRPILNEWQTALYAEADGQLRWGGLVIKNSFLGADWSIECAGFSSYPTGIPYTGTSYKTTGADPMDIAKRIWSHVQSQEDGNLGLIVTGPSTKVKIGSKDEPYTLAWWDFPDCGAEVDNLSKLTPFDYVESHAWAAGDKVTHRLDLGYPRAGRRRDDLTFIQGDNVTAVVPLDRNGDAYANLVVGLGKGEGAKTVNSSVARRDGRLRRPYVYVDKAQASKTRLGRFAGLELEARQILDGSISTITVQDHPNAPIGSWQLGDDILIDATLPWIGDVSIWHRIVSWSLLSDSKATLTLVRSDSFTYGGNA